MDITKYFAKCSFFLHKFISRQLFIPPKIFYTNSGSSYCSYSYWTETKLVALTFFCQFCQVIEHQARRVQSFSQSFKISFLIVIGREQNYTSASLQEDHKQIISCNRKCPGVLIQIWSRTKASLTSNSQVDSFFYSKLS